MIISLCTPCMGRTRDLKKCLPYRIKAANVSPPVEIVILDYNSKDGLKKYINRVQKSKPFTNGNILTYKTYTGRDYYHLAHAWNLAVKASMGDYCLVVGADTKLRRDFVKYIRKQIEEHQYDWMSVYNHNGMILLKKQVFMDIGGYDERFECYGSEDKDIIRRLKHGGYKYGRIPNALQKRIYTHNSKKIKNYRGNMTKREMMVKNAAIREENTRNSVLVANQGKEWGQWT